MAANRRHSNHQILVVLLLLNFRIVTGWFFSYDNSAEKDNLRTESAPMPDKQVPFEMQTSDANFLQHAQFTKDLSPLDLCHHMVVGEITGTCSDLTEEELNKLAVMLLNCQSESENRPTFRCTHEMSIAECTRDMDPTTWNAYQIVANRARAICYSTRQQHFRMKTEHTVNQLVANTQQQANTVKQIQAQQAAVSEAAQETLQQVSAGQQQLQAQQQQTAHTQHQLHASLALNLRSLAREKALIAAGHAEIAHMTQDIRNKLEETSGKLDAQAEKQEQNHQHLTEDIATIHSKAQEVYKKIDESGRNVIDLQAESEKHYKHTLDNLQKVNNTINYALGTFEKFKQSVETKLNWLIALIGGNGERTERLWTVVLHMVYLLLAGISAAFLHTPMFTRCVLLLIVPLNAWAELHHHNSLAFVPMTLFILLTIFANWLMATIAYFITNCRSTPPMLEHSCACSTNRPTDIDVKGLSAPDVDRLIETLEKLYEAGVLSPKPSQHPPQPPLDDEALDHIAQDHDAALDEDVLDNDTLDPLPRARASRTLRTDDKGSGDHGPDLGLSHHHQPEGEDAQPLNERRFVVPDDPHLASFRAERADNTVSYKGSPKLSSVKRHLLKSVLATPPGSPSHSLPPLSISTHTPDSTPPDSPTPSTPIRSGVSLLNASRAQCLAVTLSGLPCKNSSMEGSGFCHRHQTTPTDTATNTPRRGAKATPKGTPRGTPRVAKGTPKSTKFPLRKESHVTQPEGDGSQTEDESKDIEVQ